jgi:hypothetical protein
MMIWLLGIRALVWTGVLIIICNPQKFTSTIYVSLSSSCSSYPIWAAGAHYLLKYPGKWGQVLRCWWSCMHGSHFHRFSGIGDLGTLQETWGGCRLIDQDWSISSTCKLGATKIRYPSTIFYQHSFVCWSNPTEPMSRCKSGTQLSTPWGPAWLYWFQDELLFVWKVDCNSL